MERLFASAGLVVARSGYTTVMEMASLGLRKVVVVPTPGQSEQEYLADHLDAARLALRMDQDALDLAEAARRLEAYAGFAAPAGQRDEEARALPDFIREHPLFRPNPGG
jgi:UDP-N-acetylglucosamine:LPS N-acetylglucosamine transferase